MSEREYLPCVDCTEPDARGTSPGGRCRECDIEHAVGSSSCRECGVFIMRVEIAGPVASQHKPGCSLATADDYRPLPTRADAWSAVYGELADLASEYDDRAEAYEALGPGADAGAVTAGAARAVAAAMRARARAMLSWRPTSPDPALDTHPLPVSNTAIGTPLPAVDVRPAPADTAHDPASARPVTSTA